MSIECRVVPELVQDHAVHVELETAAERRAYSNIVRRFGTGIQTSLGDKVRMADFLASASSQISTRPTLTPAQWTLHFQGARFYATTLIPIDLAW